MRKTTTLDCNAHLRPTFSVTETTLVSCTYNSTIEHTQEANNGTKESTSLKGSGDVARNIRRVVRADLKVALEAITSNGGADKSRVIAEPTKVR